VYFFNLAITVLNKYSAIQLIQHVLQKCYSSSLSLSPWKQEWMEISSILKVSWQLPHKN